MLKLKLAPVKLGTKSPSITLMTDGGSALRVAPSGRIDRTTPVVTATHGGGPVAPEEDHDPRFARKVMEFDVAVSTVIGGGLEFKHGLMPLHRPPTLEHCSKA